MSAATPRISVLIPVYNVERFIARCLDSVLDQTFADFEVICVDDCSPDGSAAIIAEYAARDPRIRIIRHQRNLGLMEARRTGYRAANGTWLFFLDSDDRIPAGTFEKLLETATSDAGADIVVGQMFLENLEGRHVYRPREKAAGADGRNYLDAILTGTTCSLCGSLYNRRLFEGIAYTTFTHQGFSEDRMLLTQILLTQSPKVVTTPVPAYWYCLNTTSITRSELSEKALREQLTALCWCYDYVNASESGRQSEKHNRKFLTRYLSLYLEKNVPRRNVIDFNRETHRLLRFSEMRAATSMRFALHTLMLIHLPLYRRACATGRRTIRRLQGKD